MGAGKQPDSPHIADRSAVLAVPGIVDITGTKINNQTSNLTLDKDAVAVRGLFSNAQL